MGKKFIFPILSTFFPKPIWTGRVQLDIAEYANFIFLGPWDVEI
jgi:hypothetical protein